MTTIELVSWILLVGLALRYAIDTTPSNPEAPPSGLTREEPPPAPRRALPRLDTARNQRELETAQGRVGRLLLAGGSVERVS